MFLIRSKEKLDILYQFCKNWNFYRKINIEQPLPLNGGEWMGGLVAIEGLEYQLMCGLSGRRWDEGVGSVGLGCVGAYVWIPGCSER